MGIKELEELLKCDLHIEDEHKSVIKAKYNRIVGEKTRK